MKKIISVLILLAFAMTVLADSIDIQVDVNYETKGQYINVVLTNKGQETVVLLDGWYKTSYMNGCAIYINETEKGLFQIPNEYPFIEYDKVTQKEKESERLFRINVNQNKEYRVYIGDKERYQKHVFLYVSKCS